MIFYVAHREHAYTQAVVLLYHRTDLQASFRLVRYEDAGLLRGVRAGVVIWSDMDRLTSDELRRAASLSAELTEKTGLSRAELLERLSKTLPEAVNHLTPKGRLPTEAEFGQLS